MSSAQVSPILRFIRQLAVGRKDSELPDHQLLERFATRRDEAAFAALLRRHGPMILSVCQSVLHKVHDAEDAFQAAFLVLAQKAGSIQRRESVSSWLYRVAYHLAVKAQANAARRKNHEKRAAVMPSADPLLDLNLRELRGVLYEELDRLPEHYRSALVLCYLEEKTQEEAARLLGWTKATVNGRLQRGRELLRKRLRQRGLALSASLVASALGLSAASAAVPAKLTASTLRAAANLVAGKGTLEGVAVSANVAALVEGANTMFVNKTKIATIFLLALGLGMAGFAAVMQGVRAANPQREPSGAKTTTPENPPVLPKAMKQESKDSIEISGQVLDPDGKPFTGAKLYFDFGRLVSKRKPLVVRATSGADGCFRFTVSKADKHSEPSKLPILGTILAVAQGYGTTWRNIKEDERGLTLRLVKESTLTGRILDQDGKPIAGAHVHVQSIMRYPTPALDQHLDWVRKGGVGEVDHSGVSGWDGAPPGQADTLTTGADGRFRLTGLGPNDLVHFSLDGPGIHYEAELEAITRPVQPVVWRDRMPPYKLYGATFDHLAQPSRVIRGTIRDKATGKPIGDVLVSSFQTTHKTRTDREGHFELLGSAKGKSYELRILPPPSQSPYFAARVVLEDSPGLDPLNCEISLQQGILCRGRLIDKQTGKPMEGARVDYNPLFPSRYINKLGSQVADTCSSTMTEKDGSYQLAVLPGPGAIGFEAKWTDADRYMPATVDPKQLAALWGDNQSHGDEHGLFRAAGGNKVGIMGVGSYHVLTFLNPGEKDEIVTRNVEAVAARELTGRVVGPDGRPVKGVLVYGLHENPFQAETLDSDAFTIRRLNPRRTRAVVFYEKSRQLGCYREIRGDEAKLLICRLQPCGSATGRLVDGDSQPVADVDIAFFRDRLVGPGGVEVRTDKKGRFRADGLVPGQVYWGRPLRDPQRLLNLYFKGFTVKPGEVKDLGEAKVQRNN